MFRKVKDLFILNKALGQYEEIRKEIDSMPAKNILLSKTFWLNVVGLVTTVTGILPQKWAIPTLAIANIANRFLTTGAVSLLPGGGGQ